MGLSIMLPKTRPIEVVLKAVIQLPDRRRQLQSLTLLQRTLISLLITQSSQAPFLSGYEPTGFSPFCSPFTGSR